MKRVFKKFFCTMSVIAGVMLTSTCNNVGLGESVDTQPPKLAITYPEQNVIIRDSFILAGTCSDETSVKSVTVTVKNTDTGTTYIENKEATISSDNKSWQITLNNAEPADDEKTEAEKNKTYYAGWELPDGKYSVTVVATDKSGKTSDSSSLSFDIDNTAPVFVISNPGVVKNGSSKASAYGSIFTIEGSIAELHSVSSMDVTIYDSNGTVVSKENYDGEEIEAFRETDVETKGSTNITIAQSASTDDTLKTRYSEIYSNNEGTVYYTCKIVLTDDAQVYKTPDSTTDARSAAEQKTDSTGNSTANVYLNDDIYSSLLSQKLENSAKLKVSDLMNILNGSSTLDSSTIENASSILSSNVKDTSADDNSKLYFSLNPEANPTYNVIGYTYDFTDSSNLTQASSGQTVSVSVSSGLDGTLIDLDGTSAKDYTDTVKVWMREYEESPSESELSEAIGKLVEAVGDEEDEQFDKGTTDNFIEYANATEENPVTTFEDFKLIYDYGQHDTDTDESSVSSKTFGITLPENSISLNKFYILVVTGADVDDVVFNQSSIYGFLGNEAGVAPTLKITSPSNSELKNSSEFVFEGSATLTSGSLFVNSLEVTLTVTDQSSDKTVGTATRKITRSAKAEEWSTTDAFTCDTTGNWTFDITKLSEYEKIKAEESSGKNYLYTLELTGKSSSGHEDTKSSMVQVDSILPELEISSITPTVDGSEYNSSSNTYVNGTITVKGTVEETNLESVSMQIFVDGSAVSYWIDDDGNATDTLNLGKVYSFTKSIDTTKLTDAKSLDVRVTATDKVGNSKTYSSLSDSSSYNKLVILQETDKPVITLNNASNSSDFTTDSSKINAENGNLFGTISNNKISVSVSDDDLVKSVKMIVYEADGTTQVDSTTKDDIGKSTYSNSFLLPSDEGVYVVEIIATDDVLSTELSGRTPVSSTTGKFYIAVSAGAPAISVDTVNKYQTSKPAITGTVGSSATSVTATFIDVSTEKELEAQPATVQITKTGTTWSSTLTTELSDDSYKILFTAKDAYGQSSSSTASFTVDKEAPALTVTQYGANQFSGGLSETTTFYTNASTVNTVKGNASDAASKVAGVFYYVGEIPSGKEFPSTENGWYSANLGASDSAETSWTLSLSELSALTENSTYAVHIKATDNAGNASADNTYVNLVIDSRAPATTLTGTSLFDSDGSSVSTLSTSETYYAKESFSLGGTITEENLDSIKINGTAVTPTDNAWTYSPSITADGTYTYKIVLTDKALNQTEYSLIVVRDTTAPSLAVTSPVAASNTKTGSLTLEGNVSDTGSGIKQISYVIKAAANSENADITGSKAISTSGNWTIEDVKITNEGTYTLTVTARDVLGNEKTSNAITFYYDNTAPTVVAAILDAAQEIGDYKVYNSTTFNVKVESTDVVSGVAGVVANSTTTLVKDTDGCYTGKVIASLNDDGKTSISIVASDKFGNSNTTTISNLMVDVTPPALAITNYPENSTNLKFTLSGTVSDNLAVESVVVTDSLDASKSYTATVADGTWSVTLTPSSTASGDNETIDGSHTYTVKATDKVGNSSSASCKVTTDTAAPYWYTGNKQGTEPYISTKASSSKITMDSVEYSLYSSTSVTIAAKAKDATTSVEALLYNLNDSQKSGTSGLEWTEAENSSIAVESLVQGLNTIKIKAVDEAGNETSYVALSLFVDSLAPAEPTLKSVGDDKDASSMSDFASQNKQKLVNGKSDLSFTVAVQDDISNGDSTYSGIASVELTKIGNSERSIAGTFVSTDDGTDVYSITIPAENLASGSATVTVKDKAGNSTKLEMFNLVLDNKAPTVTLSAPKDADSSTADVCDVNKTISLTGNATDNQTLDESSIYLQYSTDNTTWTTLTTDNAGSDYKVEWNSGISATGIDTTKFTDKSTIYIRAAATDEAQNTGYSEALTLYVNQDSDRPVVKIDNLTKLSDGTFILKYGKDAQVTGTVSDDDSTTGSAVAYFAIAEEAIVGMSGENFVNASNVTVTNLAEFTSSSGDFTFTPSDKEDGAKTFYIYIKDNGGSEFYTTAATGTGSNGTTYLANPKLYLKTEQLSDSVCVKEFTYNSDSTSPKVNNVEGKISASATERSSYSGISVSFVAGGDENVLNLRVTASDANGIAGLLLDITDSSKNTLFKRATASEIAENSIESSTTESDGNFTKENSTITSATKYYVNSSDTKENSTDGTIYTWELASAIDLSGVDTDSLIITVTAYDNSGLTGNGSYTFMVDNSGPSVNMTSPGSSTIVSGSSINVTGTATEIGSSTVDSIQWLIPTTTQTGLNDSALNELTWQGELSSTSTASAWTFVFNGTSNALLSNFTKDTTYASPDDDGVYTLPIYFKATDALGNYTICRDYSIRYNPDADRPVTQITYPDSSILTSDGYAILGGKIRVTGTVEIPSGDSTAYQVYLQVSDDDGGFDTDDKSTASNTYGFTVLDADGLQTAWQKDCGSSTDLNFSNDATTNTTKKTAWWGIPATLYSSKTSWYIVINNDDKMNATSGTNNVKIRVCAVGANGKVGLWSDAYSIHIDSQVPRYSDSPLLYQYSSELSSGENFYSATPSSAQSYSSGVYLKGQWYLCTSVTDETSVKINSVYLGSTLLSAGTDYFVYPSGADNSSGNASGSTLTADSRYIAYVYIKIDKEKTSTQSYTITAEDSDANASNTSTATFEVNADNEGPTFALNSSSKPVITDGNDSEISMTKLKNSDHVVTFGSTATDSGSGFERIAFYFKRTVDGTTTVELPIPSGDSSAWSNSASAAYVGEITDSGSLQTDKDFTDTVAANYNYNALYGVTLSGTSTVDSSANTTTFTASSSISDYKFIRAGGIIKLSGIYYTISGVNGNAITVDGSVSTLPATAFAPAALIVDNTSSEVPGTWSSGFKISGDDGDGIIESVKKSGVTWTWDVSVYLDELDDGPVTLVTMAFDKAGNVRTLETPVMIANNTPRLAKVYLATDLNGDGKFTDNELGTSTMADTNETQKFYSALTNGTSGRVQEILTIENESGSGVTGITMRNDLGLSFEFVSGYEGYGSGNGTLSYKLAVGNSALTEATSGTDGTLETATSATYDATESTTTASIVSSGLTGFKIPTTKFKYGSNTSGFDYSEWASSNVTDGNDNNAINYIGVTLWDSTKGTAAGTGDTVDSDGNITAFGSQWTVVNIPLYIDLVDDQFPVPLIDDPTADSSSGHVDLSSTLPDANFTSTSSGEYDTDTKISGTVVFTGTVTDEKRVDSIYLTTSSKFSSTAVSSVKVASYNSSTGSFSLSELATGLTFAITSNEFSTESGHTVGWSLTVDTSVVEGVAAADVVFTVAASDGTNTNVADATVEPAQYQADIVPYITGIVRSGTTYSNTTMNRSTYGEYPVAVGDTLKVNGWNFGTSPVVNVGTKSATASDADGTSFTISSPENSGELTVTVNSIVSLNHKNNNATETNLDADGKYDNRYIRVWDVGHYFGDSESGNEPTLAADISGNLFSTWTLMGTGSVMMQRTLSSASYPIYAGYDQPDKETQLGIDKKSTDSGSVSVIFFPANVGSGGTPSSNGYADAQNIGGVWGLGMSNNVDTSTITSNITATNDSSKEYERYYGVIGQKNSKQIRIKGNPYNQLDSTTWTAGWQLASGAMRREVSQFKQGRTARYGANMHYVYYDSVNKALRYTYQTVLNGSEKKGDNAYRNTISGWTLIDGKNDSQDRIHSSSTSYSGVVNAYTGTTVTLSGSYTVSAGDTVAIAYLNTSGVYKIALRTVATASSGTSVTVTGSVPSDISSVTGGAIYRGDSNVVTNGASQSSSAGSYLALDVTSSGKPVIVYYDAGSEGLRIAYSTSATPSMTDISSGRGTWTRQTISGVSGGTYVQAKIDGSNYLHIMYRDSDGKLCYLKSTNAPDGGAYEFGEPMTIDSSGTYGTLSVMKTDSGYVPCVSWLNSEGTANGVKYALLRNVDTGDGTTKSLWDVQIVPAVVSEGNHYVSGGELVYVEGKTGSWNATEDDVSMSACDAVVGFNTGRMDVVFLKSEK